MQITDDDIARVKRELDLGRLVQQDGITLRKHGKNDLAGLCPFHNDKNPSLIITPSKNLWHCLGACKVGGSPIDWVMKTRKITFTEAVSHGLSLLPSGMASGTATSATESTSTKETPQSTAEATDLRGVTTHYHKSLQQHPKALDYLQNRSISPDAIDFFKIGFGDRSFGKSLSLEERKPMQEAGIIRASGHEHFSGSITVPLFDDTGNTVEIYGRKITEGLRKGTPNHLYLPGAHRGVFNPIALDGKELILCESLIDALSFWSCDLKNVTSTFGTEGFSEELYTRIVASSVKRVYFAFDNDPAGDKASLKHAAKLIADGIECFRITFPSGTDANEYVCNQKEPAKALQELVSVAQRISPSLGKEASYRESLHTLAGNTLASSTATEITLSKGLPEHRLVGEDIYIHFGKREYRLRGLFKSGPGDSLKVNLRLYVEEGFYLDTLDLYQSRGRESFVQKASFELDIEVGIIKKDLGRIILKCEALREEKLAGQEEAKSPQPSMSDVEKQKALAYLKDPDLIRNISRDFHARGLVGEGTNALLAYLACVSRKMNKPLGIIVQSSSSAGKSALMDAVLDLMPQEEKSKYSAMTGQSLYYMGESVLKHKILAICEEEGAQKASFALKLLQSDGVLTIAATGKDPDTGRLGTIEYKVEGPVMIFITTTSIEIDEELLNRCITLTVDESREQTRRIQKRQRFAESLAGLEQEDDSAGITELHHNVQRLLEPVLVANPYAESLSFLDRLTRTRRDHLKYLTIIRSIAFLRQYQKEKKKTSQGKDYIEVDLSDIELANAIAHDALGRSLDELPPRTRNLLNEILKMVREGSKKEDIEERDFRFSRRNVRDYTGMGHSQLAVHMQRLEDMEYLNPGRIKKGIVYELMYRGEGEYLDKFALGLLDTSFLQKYDANHPGVNGDHPALEADHPPPIRPTSGALPPPFRGGTNGVSTTAEELCRANGRNMLENA